MKHATKVWNAGCFSMNLPSFWGTVIRSSQASRCKGRRSYSEGRRAGTSQLFPGYCQLVTAAALDRRLGSTLPTQLRAASCTDGAIGGRRAERAAQVPPSLSMGSGPGGDGRAHRAGEPAGDSSACETHQKADVVGQILLLDRNIIKLVQERATTHNRWDSWCPS